MKRRYRLACLVSHPIQYQAPLFRYLSSHFGIDLTVFFLSDISVRKYQDPGFGADIRWDVPLLDGYSHVFLPCVGARDRLSWWCPLTYGLRRHLKAGRFDVLWVHGYAHQALLRAAVIAKGLGIKVLLRGESHLRGEQQGSMKLRVKESLLPRLFELIDGFLAIGTLNREYYLHYGVPADLIFMTPYAVDNAFFRTHAEQARPRREELRRELGLARGQPVILYASKFQSRKRANDLLEAYIRLSPDETKEPRPYLLMVGDGELRPKLEARVRELGWSSVRLPGFKNQTELPRYYDLCDVFVLPSEREPWGLVINEVMNAGKPVIVSDRVGAGPDLVRDGQNGFVVPVGDIDALADRLDVLTRSPETALKMGAKSRERIASWDFEADLRGLLAALEATARC
jgi:glycosyltransferase involved in cell wall biosynthesis